MTETDITAQAVEKVLNGDVEAFSELVRECEPAVRIFLGARLNDAALVDDLAQETFIAGFNSLRGYRKEDDFTAWLVGIARNKLTSHFRKTYREANRLEQMRREIFDQAEPRLMERAGEFVHAQAERVRECMAKLTDRVRKIVVAKYFNNMRVQDVARKAGLPPNAISAVLLRGRKQIEQCLRSATPAMEVNHD